MTVSSLRKSSWYFTFISVITAAFLSCRTSAQESYTLTEDDQWTKVESAEPGSPEAQLSLARQALANEEYDRAETMAGQWLERYEHHPLRPDAFLIRGDALMAQHSYYQAAFEYEAIARLYPSAEAFVTALERELEIAKLYAHGTKRKIWGIRIFSAADEAEELLIRIQERMPGSQLAEEAGIELADFYFRRRDMQLAADAYDLFIINYPQSEKVDTAKRRLIYAHLASFKGPEFDATGLIDARVELKQLEQTAPLSAEKIGSGALIARIDESRAQKMLNTAKWYLKIRDYISAEYTIRGLVKKYPRSLATASALRLIDEIIPELPQSVLDEAPDYAAYQAGLIDLTESPLTSVEDDSEPEAEAEQMNEAPAKEIAP